MEMKPKSRRVTSNERCDLRLDFVQIRAEDEPHLIARGFAQRDELRCQLPLSQFARNVDEPPTNFRVMFEHQIRKRLRVVELRYDKRILSTRLCSNIHSRDLIIRSLDATWDSKILSETRV